MSRRKTMRSDDDYREWFEDTILPHCLRQGALDEIQLPCFMLTVAKNGACIFARLTSSAPHQRVTLEVLSTHDVDDGMPGPCMVILADAKPSATTFGIPEYEPTSD
jgi:hypothetical protein